MMLITIQLSLLMLILVAFLMKLIKRGLSTKLKITTLVVCSKKKEKLRDQRKRIVLISIHWVNNKAISNAARKVCKHQAKLAWMSREIGKKKKN